MTTNIWGRLGAISLGAICLLWAAASEAGLPFRFEAPPGWRAVAHPGVDAMWSARDARHTAVSVFTMTADEPLVLFDGFSLDDYVAGLTEVRNFTQAAYGITGWTVDKSSITKLPKQNALLFKLTGHYTGVKGQRVNFEEWEYFAGMRYFQVTFATEGTSVKDAAQVLARFTPTLEAK